MPLVFVIVTSQPMCFPTPPTSVTVNFQHFMSSVTCNALYLSFCHRSNLDKYPNSTTDYPLPLEQSNLHTHRWRNQWGTGGTCPPETFLTFKCSSARSSNVTAPTHTHCIASQTTCVMHSSPPTSLPDLQTVPHVHMRMNASCLVRVMAVLQ